MRYADILDFDVVNGKGIGVSVFVQGCHFHCLNCFNSELWDFSKGNEWTTNVEKNFMELINRPYIERVSILGGEPLDSENIEAILSLVNNIKLKFPYKTIWLYTGFTWEEIWTDFNIVIDDYTEKIFNEYKVRQEILKKCDYLVDGQFINELKDLTLPFRGSSNQRIIDIQKSIERNSITQWKDKK